MLFYSAISYALTSIVLLPYPAAAASIKPGLAKIAVKLINTNMKKQYLMSEKRVVCGKKWPKWSGQN